MNEKHQNIPTNTPNFEFIAINSGNTLVIKELKKTGYSIVAVNDSNKTTKLFSFELSHEIQIDFNTLQEIYDALSDFRKKNGVG